MGSIGRTPVTIVEIQQPKCSRVYGTSPCTAAVGVTGTRKCFNTRGTCQDVANYSGTDTIILRFAKPHDDVPGDQNIIPSLQSVQTMPTKINVGGRTNNERSLGLRAEANIVIADHVHSDNIVDPYLSERDYNPLERGTFWAKWIKRNPYNSGFTLIVYEGYAGESIASMQSRIYTIDKIEGPNSNNAVTIRAQDILRLADDNKVKYPALTTGKLLSGISDSATASLTLTGALITDYNVYGSNYVRINNEIVGYASVAANMDGDLVFSTLTRAQFGTSAEAHDEDDTAQACVYYDGVEPWLIVRDLLLSAGVPNEYIDYDAWVDEAETWLANLTVTNFLSEPTGVNQLIGELCEQCSFYIWFDERQRSVEFRAIKPAIGEVALITETDNLIQGTTQIKLRPELRASEVWVSYLPRDNVRTGRNRADFRRTAIRVDDDNLFPERKVYEIYSRWLNNEVQVNLLTFRLLARYKLPSFYLTFELDAKDRSLMVGDPFDFEYRGITDDTGAPERRRYQVISAHESPAGERIKIEAQVFDYSIDFRVSLIVANDSPDYAGASDAQRLVGCWISDNNGLIDGDNGYVIT